MQRDPNRLEDILTGTVGIASFIEGLNFESFVADRRKRYNRRRNCERVIAKSDGAALSAFDIFRLCWLSSIPMPRTLL